MSSLTRGMDKKKAASERAPDGKHTREWVDLSDDTGANCSTP